MEANFISKVLHQRFKDKTIDCVVLMKTTNEIYIHYPSQNYSDEENQSDLN